MDETLVDASNFVEDADERYVGKQPDDNKGVDKCNNNSNEGEDNDK